MRRHVTYANVAATLALFFAMSGAAIATKHYLINSTKQISPKVLKTLTGKRGPAGKEGPPGKEGKVGPEGKEGKSGSPGEAAARLFAVVSAGGELVRGSGAIKVALAAGGGYNVQFNRNITKCVYEATVGTTGIGGLEKGIATVGGTFETEDSVFVRTENVKEEPQSKPFHLAVFC